MRHAFVATLFVTLTCAGCGQSAETPDDQSSSGSEGFTLSESEVHRGTTTAEGGGFEVTGHAEIVPSAQVCRGGGWTLDLRPAVGEQRSRSR